MKAIVLTRGDLTDVLVGEKKHSKERSKARREKSAEAIVPDDREGLNNRKS